MKDVEYINGTAIRLVKGDITDLDVECFVFYAESDLKLGSGFGGAIAVRGGPSIQKELDSLAPIGSGEAVMTDAGELKARCILHANGPKFQEVEIEAKLRQTVRNAVRVAEEKGVKQIAFPPMGTGFYGIPLDTSARVTLGTLQDILQNGCQLQEVIICALDYREFKPYQIRLQELVTVGETT